MSQDLPQDWVRPLEKDDDIIGMISQLSLKVRVNPSIRTSDNLDSDYMYDIHKCLQLKDSRFRINAAQEHPLCIDMILYIKVGKAPGWLLFDT